MPISRLLHHLYTENPFIFTIVTVGVNDTFTLPLEASGSYNCQVIWGDGNNDKITAWDAAEVTHTYATAGTYTVVIIGEITGWRFAFGGDRTMMRDIIQWGGLRLGNNTRYFCGCTNLTVSALDNLNLTGTTTLDRSFELCPALTTVPSMDKWDLSSVTDLWEAFHSSTSFNQDIGSWDVSNVVDFHGMFHDTAFNQDIGSWDLTSADDLDHMFALSPFNQDIGSWDVSNVRLMRNVFYDNTAFNQDIGSWDISNCEEIGSMFSGAAAFNQDISLWNLSKCATMSYMFKGATLFNQDIGSWVVSLVTDMSGVFEGAAAFNQDISSWSLSNVLEIDLMFCEAAAFNQPLNAWDVSSVTTTRNTFADAVTFNQPLNLWDVSSVTNMEYMFYNATAFDQNIGGWDITAVTAMTGMFSGVTLSTANYDALLIGWEGQAVSNNVVFSGGNSKYSAGAAATARQALIDDHSWSITDGGQV